MNKLQRLELKLSILKDALHRDEKSAEMWKRLIIECEAKIEAEQAKDEEWPKVGDWYWFLNMYSEIIEDIWDDGSFAHDRKNAGNCYRTKEEAQRIANYRKDPIAQAREKLAAFAYECNGGECLGGGWEFFVSDDGCLSFGRLNSIGTSGAFFASDLGGQAAIDALGEELIELACGVKK